jgi:molecular chaperone DnaJ
LLLQNGQYNGHLQPGVDYCTVGLVLWHNGTNKSDAVMVRKRNHYQILGLETDVTAQEIKRAYRRLAKTQHPDAQASRDSDAHEEATEEMMRLNEAYETLMDKSKRAEYDRRIGLGKLGTGGKRAVFTSFDEDAAREKFLRTVFHPARSAIVRVLGGYKRQLRELSADPYDDALLEKFQQYMEKLEDALRQGSNSLTRSEAPRSLQASVQMMRYAIAQAADGLEELGYFCNNYDYSHLSLAESLFRIATDLLRQALDLSRGG